MPTVPSDQLIRRWSERFRKHALATRVVVDLRGRADQISQGAFQRLQHESLE